MKRKPKHIGIIPDGNRRWAAERGLPKEAGYNAGLLPGLDLFRLAKEEGIEELTFYGFTQDNTKRSKEQVKAFQRSCVEATRTRQYSRRSYCHTPRGRSSDPDPLS